MWWARACRSFFPLGQWLLAHEVDRQYSNSLTGIKIAGSLRCQIDRGTDLSDGGFEAIRKSVPYVDYSLQIVWNQ